MITLFLVLFAIGSLTLSISYRHALLFAKSKLMKKIIVSAVFTAICLIMSYLAFLFGDSIKDTFYFSSAYVAMFMLIILSFKAYFFTLRNKFSENIFDLTVLKNVFLLSFSFSFEVFLAGLSVYFVYSNTCLASILFGVFLFLFLFFGFFAGNRPKHLKSIRIFILFASAFYLFAALSCIYYLIVNL